MQRGTLASSGESVSDELIYCRTLACPTVDIVPATPHDLEKQWIGLIYISRRRTS
jgi:hypothetical protein